MNYNNPMNRGSGPDIYSGYRGNLAQIALGANRDTSEFTYPGSTFNSEPSFRHLNSNNSGTHRSLLSNPYYDAYWNG